MSTRKQSPRNRAFRPTSDVLESRQLLSGVVSGTDIDGDIWTLRLVGPGSMTVVKQDDASGNPTDLAAHTEIDSIRIGGTDPTKTRLIGSLIKAPTGDGKVFFQNLEALTGTSKRFTGVGLGMLSINMPQFWLGNTTPTGATTTPAAPNILLPDGVDTLRFGGVDTTHNPITPTSTTQDDTTIVELGLPMYGGTRIIIDKSISSTQSAPPASGSTTNRTIQHQVVFSVSGRLQEFQANEIVGDAAHPPGQFQNQDPAATGSGGTAVVSTLAASTPFFTTTSEGVIKGSVGGQIGFVRVGGDATNFTTIVEDPTRQGTDHISNFYIGGETKNVMLIAPSGANTVVFGKGMDTVEIRSQVIDLLKANRGAINSNVVVDREISLIELGGDVVDTNVISGAVQSFTDIINTVTGQSNSIFSSSSPAAPPLPINARTDGDMTVHIAGDITNSVFAASTEPFNGVYGSPNQLILPTGKINAKVEGTINNAVATPDSPGKAFYAQRVELDKSPVAPAGVPEQPFTHRSNAFLPGLHTLRIPGSSRHKAAVTAASAVQPRARLPIIRVGRATPKGPQSTNAPA